MSAKHIVDGSIPSDSSIYIMLILEIRREVKRFYLELYDSDLRMKSLPQLEEMGFSLLGAEEKSSLWKCSVLNNQYGLNMVNGIVDLVEHRYKAMLYTCGEGNKEFLNEFAKTIIKHKGKIKITRMEERDIEEKMKKLKPGWEEYA